MKFTAVTESNNRINYLDITIYRTLTNWMTSIYRKPTVTDTIILYSSNHPAQHKYAAIRILRKRLKTYHLHKNEFNEEINTIYDIMLNNGFPIHTHKIPTHRHLTSTSDRQQTTPHINGSPLQTMAKRPHLLQTCSKRQTRGSHCEQTTPFRNY